MVTLSKDFAIGAVVGATAAVVVSKLCCATVCSTSGSPASAKTVRSTTASGSTVYESAKATDEYLQFHYAKPEELLPYEAGPRDALEFMERAAEGVIAAHMTAVAAAAGSTKGGGKGGKKGSGKKQQPKTRALDVGCAVGRASFELARGFDEVVGVDFSHAFIRAANEMKEQGKKSYTQVIEADVTTAREARVPADIQRERVTFQQGDACNLPASLGQFDAVLASNLLCRLPDPQAFLARLSSLVKPGGVVVLISPYSWLDEYTPRKRWMGGFISDDGFAVSSSDAVVRALTRAGFNLLESKDVPFLIREHARKFQWGCSHGTVWQRVASD